MDITTQPIIFAKLSDKPGLYACLTFSAPADGLSVEESRKVWDQIDQLGPQYSIVASDDPADANLPILTDDAAQDVAMHAYHSGADVKVAAMVSAQHGEDAMYDYADTQNMYSMPGAPDIPEEELKWVGSGLTPTIQQGA